MKRLTLALTIALVPSCNLDSETHYEGFYDKVNATSTGGDDVGEGSSTGFEPVNTVTSASPDDDPGDDAPSDDPGPRILSFTATPTAISEAGPVELTVAYTPEVTGILLFDDHGGETQLLAELEPGQSTWEYAITSQAQFDGEHELHAIVVDEDDRWDEATTDLSVDLHEAGSLVWVNDGKDDASEFEYAVAAAADDTGVVVVVRDMNAGQPPSMVRRHDGLDGDLVWQYVAPDDVTVTAIARAPSGDMVIAGYSANEEAQRMWVHQLDAETGEPVWSEPEDWSDGTRATAVAVTPAGDIVVVGRETVNGMFGEETRVYAWRLPADPKNGFVSAMWIPNDVSPSARATSVAVSASGRVIVGGTMTTKPNHVDEVERGFVLEFDETLEPLWIAGGGDFESNTVRAVDVFSEDVMVAGWFKDISDPVNPFYAVAHRLAEGPGGQLHPVWTRSGPQGQGSWVASDVNGQILLLRSSFETIETIALSPESADIWDFTYGHAYADASANAGTLDRWGNTYFAGMLSNNGKLHTVVGKVRP